MKSIRAIAVIACLAGLVLVLAFTLRADPASSQSSVAHLQQNWSDAQEQTYYHTSQGTVILPVSWLAALQSPDGQPFMSAEHMRKLGFIADEKSSANPYGWPIGFAIYPPTKLTGGTETVGLTCAACHTGEITYRGKTLRVDGGQAHINLDVFKDEINDAILWNGGTPERVEAFKQRAVKFGFPADRIGPEFEARYKGVLATVPDRQRIAAEGTIAGPGRTDAYAVGARVAFNYAIGVPANQAKATGPVDYPYLWNIWNFDWVQYNAAIKQPMSRNIGEALGVGAVTNIIDEKTGALNPEPERWRTTIALRNLAEIETLLRSLQPPRWPEAILGPVDPAQAKRGAQLFVQHCSHCHGIRALAGSQYDEWSLRILQVDDIGTDPMEAMNFRNGRYDATKLGLSSQTDIATGLRAVIDAVRKQGYVDAQIPPAQWGEFDGFNRPNEITMPCGYRARPLVGAWATPPFLHNGSVPTVFDMLSDSRPEKVRLGGTEYDPVKLGLSQADAANTVLRDTSLVGNSNAGHWFTDDAARKGRVGRRLTDDEKYDLIAYLKSASYDNYPRTTVKAEDPEPCISAAYENQKQNH